MLNISVETRSLSRPMWVYLQGWSFCRLAATPGAGLPGRFALRDAARAHTFVNAFVDIEGRLSMPWVFAPPGDATTPRLTIRFEATFAKVNFAITPVEFSRLGRRDEARRHALLDARTDRLLRPVNGVPKPTNMADASSEEYQFHRDFE